MYFDKDSWLNTTKAISKQFIENHYSQESLLFDAFWHAFSFKVNNIFRADAIGELTLDETEHALADISFARNSAIDSVSPIVLPTVASIMQQIQIKKFSENELEELISTTAAHFGAKPSLTACLTRSLPSLCNEIMSYDPDASQVAVSVTSDPQYRIWTNAESTIVSSIINYEKIKDKYLFWIDLDNRPKTTKASPSPQAIELLKYLVTNIGLRCPVDQVLRNVFKDTIGDSPEHDKNKIDQQLTQLNNCSEKQFRKYIFRKWFENGLGLDNSFKDKYFLFTRLR